MRINKPKYSISIPFSLVVFVLLLVISAVYFNSIKSPFYYDDFHLLKENPKLAESGSLSFLFQPRQYYEVSKESTYRPVTTAVYSFFKNVLSDNPSYCRIFNIALHLANCLLLFLLLRQLKLDEWLALLAVSLFAVHPLHTELINVITFNEDMIGGFFCLLAFYGYLRERWEWRIISLGAYLLSCFAKETFVVLPLLLFFFDLWQVPHKLNWRQLLTRQFGYWIVCLLFLFINLSLMKDVDAIYNATYPGGTITSAFLTFMVALSYYLKLFFFPVGLTPVYSFPAYTSILAWPVAASFVLLLVIAGVIIYGYRHQKAYAFYLIWFFLFLLPTSNIIPFWTSVAERFLYFPLMGLIPGMLLLGGWGLDRLGFDERKYLSLFGVIFLLFLAVLTVKRNVIWQDPEILWQDTLKKAPESIRPHSFLALYYHEKKEYAKAIHHYQICIDSDLKLPSFYSNLGRLYLTIGDKHKARYNFEKAVARKEYYTSQNYLFGALFDLGMVCFQLKDYQAAYQNWLLAKEVKPDHQGLIICLTMVNEKLGLKQKEAR